MNFTLSGKDAKVKYKFKGSGPKGINTFAFYVIEKGVDIMKEGGIPEVMLTVDNEDSESSLQKSAGTYYLDVNATGLWEISVEELK